MHLLALADVYGVPVEELEEMARELLELASRAADRRRAT